MASCDRMRRSGRVRQLLLRPFDGHLPDGRRLRCGVPALLRYFCRYLAGRFLIVGMQQTARKGDGQAYDECTISLSHRASPPYTSEIGEKSSRNRRFKQAGSDLPNAEFARGDVMGAASNPAYPHDESGTALARDHSSRFCFKRRSLSGWSTAAALAG